VSATSSDNHIARNAPALDLGMSEDRFGLSNLQVSDHDFAGDLSPKLPKDLSFDPSMYPDGTLLWKSMRAHNEAMPDGQAAAGNIGPGLFEYSSTEVGSELVRHENVSCTHSEPKKSAEAFDPSREEARPEFSIDANLIEQAQWSVTALDHVFTHMASSFMEQVDFTKIDFDALAQA
jgi:hypothetical protein